MFETQTNKKTKAPAEPKSSRADASPGEQAADKLNPVWQSLALNPASIQTKLAISQPADPYEREADHVADQVMRMAAPPSISDKLSLAPLASFKAQRKCNHCEEEKKLQRKEQDASPGSVGDAPPIVNQALRSPGQPLDPETRAFFEPRFGENLGQVRVHSDSQAEASAQAVNAKAYTVGQHIVFGANRYAPDSAHGRRLLAHELTHVFQQAGAKPSLQRDAEQDKDPPKMSISGDSERKSPAGGVAVRNGTLEWTLKFVGKDTEVTKGDSGDMSFNMSLGQDVNFKATFKPQAGVSACSTITFTQTVQPTTGGTWDTGQLLYTRSPKSGASVDLSLEQEPKRPETEPFYSVGPRASGPGLEQQRGSATAAPSMADAPFLRTVPKGATAVRKFESAVVCVETAETFGSISWGYTKTDSGVVTLVGGTAKDVMTTSASAAFEPTRQAFYTGFFQLSLNEFAVGGDALTQKHTAALDALDTKDLARIILVGANDNSGGAEANANLSLKRAEAVRDYLVKKRGVSATLITTEGHGVEARVPNPPGQKVGENRRVDVHLQRGATTFKPANIRLGSASERNRISKQNPRLTVKEAVEAIVRLDATTGRIPMGEWVELTEMLNALDDWRRVDPTVPDVRQSYSAQLSRLQNRAQVITSQPGREPFPQLGPISPDLDESWQKYQEAKQRVERLKRERDEALRRLDREYQELKEDE